MGILQKYTCGEQIPSSSLFYTGTIPSFITESSVLRDRNFDCFLEKIGEEINTILPDLDLKKLDKKCLDFDPNTVSIKELHDVIKNETCQHDTALTSIETELSTLIIGDKIIKFDLGCLSPDLEDCENPSTEYTLQFILETFIAEVCELKDDIESFCNPQNGTSGTSGENGTSGTSGNDSSGTSGASGTSGTSGSTSGASYYYLAEPYLCSYCSAPVGPSVTVASFFPVTLFNYYRGVPFTGTVYRPISTSVDVPSYIISGGDFSCVQACNPIEP